MRRADRLFQIIQILRRGRGPKRAQDIARELAPPDIAERFPRIAAGYAELTVHRRQSASGKDEHGKLRLRDDVLLASWFTGEDPGPGADEIWVRLARGEGGPHLTVRTWQTEAELKTEMLAALVQHVEAIRDDQDEVGFGCSLGGVESKGAVYFNNHWPDGNRLGAARSCEHWQILSPVHGKGHGVDELNRFLHERFRRSALQLSQRRGSRTPLPAGAQRIIYGDKVICTGNERRGMLSQSMGQVSNGEIGIVVGQAKFGARWDGKTPERIDVEFGTQLGTTFKYWKSDFGDDGRVVLELAYALTIHKSQGSQFGVTFVVIPQPCFILGRELLYTALTRQQDRVVLLVQGQPSDLRAYSGPRHSEVARRYTNLFRNRETAFLLFFLGEYVAIVLMCALTTILFLGGWLSPLPFAPFTWVPGVIWFVLKMSLVFFMFAMVKAFVPRYRYDQLMRLGWKVFLPLSLAMVVVVALVLHLTGWGGAH